MPQIDIIRLCEALNQQALAASAIVTEAENPITLQANYTASIILYRLSSALAIAARIEAPQPQESSNG